MSSVQCLRQFVTERLTAAAEEIFTVFEKTIVEYEEEIDRQRRLLDVVWKPEVKLHRIELPQLHVSREKEEVFTVQQLCDWERNFFLDQEDPDPPLIKEEQEELCNSQKKEQHVQKQETDDVTLISPYEESDHSETEPDGDRQFLSHSSPLAHISTMSEAQCDTHTGETTFKCDTCGKAFKYKYNLCEHLRLHTELPQPHLCEEEKEVLTDQPLWDWEKNSSLNQDDPDPPQIKEEQEELCTSQEGEQLELKDETDDVTLIPPYEESDHSEREPEPEPDGDHQFLSHSSPVAHISTMSEAHCETHSGEKTFKCDTCGKSFKCKYNLSEHLRLHTGEKLYVCNTCGKRFTRNSLLITHLRVHTGERPYVCDTCGKSFRQTSHLKYHTQKHTGEKPYSCKTCGRAFKSSDDLKVHRRRVHTGDKPYLCNTCGKRFRLTSLLTIHLRIHTGEKPYSCKTCGKTFRISGDLKAHMKRIHTGEKRCFCNTCGKRFYGKSHLRSHMRTHITKNLD